jgi:hypothetical protein
VALNTHEDSCSAPCDGAKDGPAVRGGQITRPMDPHASGLGNDERVGSEGSLHVPSNFARVPHHLGGLLATRSPDGKREPPAPASRTTRGATRALSNPLLGRGSVHPSTHVSANCSDGAPPSQSGVVQRYTWRLRPGPKARISPAFPLCHRPNCADWWWRSSRLQSSSIRSLAQFAKTRANKGMRKSCPSSVLPKQLLEQPPSPGQSPI